MAESISFHARPTGDITVATLTNASPEIIRTFIQTNRHLGVAKQVIYLDSGSPTRKLLDLAGDDVRFISCDQSFWQKVSGRERSNWVEDRQFATYDHAYAECTTGWLGICDIDEFFVPRTSYSELLASVPERIESLRSSTWEAVWDEGAPTLENFSATHCRTQTWTQDGLSWLRMHRPLFSVLTGRGLCGHFDGKSIVRAGISDALMGIHDPDRMLNGKRVHLNLADNLIDLVHFDAISYGEWEKKFQNRKKPDGKMGGQSHWRRILGEMLALNMGEDARYRLFEEIYVVKAERGYRNFLQQYGKLRPIENFNR